MLTGGPLPSVARDLLPSSLMPDDDEIQWEEPPAELLGPRKGVRPYAAFATRLREHKDRWAVMPSSPLNEKSARAQAIGVRRGKIAGFDPPGAYEAVVDPKAFKVYVRYVGVRDGHAPVVNMPRSRRTINPDNTRIRQWARDQGITLAPQGRIPANIVQAFDKAQGR